MCIDAGGVEVQRTHFDAGEPLQESCERAFDGVRSRRGVRLRECPTKIGRRDEIAAQRLRQRPDQRGRLVGHEARRQPRQARIIERVQQVQRHRDGHAVVDRTRIEAVLHGQARTAKRDVGRIQRGIGLVDHQQVVARPLQQALLFLRQLGDPGVQRLRVVHVRRQAVQVPACLPVLVHHQADTALLGFLLLRQFQGAQVARQERTARVDLARQQGIAHEDDAGFLREQRAVMHRLLRRQHQPEQADLLAAEHPALRARPVRLVVSARKQMRQLRNRKIGFDRGIGQRPDFFGIQQRCGQHPRRRLGCEVGAREQLELAPARAIVDPAVAAIADVGGQAGDQCAMECRERKSRVRVDFSCVFTSCQA